MPTTKITARSVAAAKSADRDTYLWDSDLSGFALKTTPAGTRTYLVQYRLGGRAATTRRVTIGKHGSPWTPDTARKRAKQILGEVASGRDPAEALTEARKDLTVAGLCDLYVSEGCATKKSTTRATDRGRIERHIKPLLGRKRCRSVTRGTVERFMLDVADGKTAADVKTGPRGRAIVRGGPGTATKAVNLLGAIFTFAVNRRLLSDNPVRGVKTFNTRKHERFLSPAELGRLGDTLSVAEEEGANPVAIAAIRLLAMTGCRKSEILTLRWEHVDFERGCLRLPDSKTGAKAVPVGAPVLELLTGLSRIDSNPYVLPSSIGEGHFVGLPKIWRRVREKAGLPDLRLHDLRHSFASVGAASGDSLLIIGKLLGHAHTATTQRYAHLSDDPLKATAERISGQVAAAMKAGNGQSAEIVELPKQKA
jgi:integrase